MALELATHWLWDFWLARDGAEHHLFYLQAPRSLGREVMRHCNATVGHAVSRDLRDWKVRPDAVAPGPAGAWDDRAVWTGSVIAYDGRWWMLYTGVAAADDGLIQRIGLAVSDDLEHWERHPANPVLEADPRWYEQGLPAHWHDQAWRDPYLLCHPDTGEFHAFISARASSGPVRGRGVIAHARSADLEHWQVLPPVAGQCARYGQLELPQVVEVDGRWVLLFSRSIEYDDACNADATTGTHLLMSDDPLGPYDCDTEAVLAADAAGSLYSGKLVHHDGRWWFLAFRNYRGGDFVGSLTDPLPVDLVDGRPVLS